MIRLFAVLTVLALSVAQPTLSDVISRIERGAADGDATALRPAIADAEKLADVTDDDREREHALLAAAYGAWRLSTVQGVASAEASNVLGGAAKNLREVIKMNTKSGEAMAQLATVLGQQIRLGGNKMELGPEAAVLRAAALNAAPNNPRVVVQSAMTLYFTPVEYGGGVDKAEAELRRAVAMFEREPAGRPWPNWGRFDVHVWLGQALAARGDKAGAATEYNLALKAWPNSNWVKHVLIPALTK